MRDAQQRAGWGEAEEAPPEADDPRGALDPEIAALFTFLRAARAGRAPETVTMRAEAKAAEPLLAGFEPRAAVERDIEVPGPRGPIRVRLLYPGEPSEAPYPVLIYFHGGGYMLGSLETCIHLTRQLARQAGVLVASVDYRLAPEHPHPQPFDDCLAATRWMRAHAAEIGGDPRALALIGDSAGGHAAVAVALCMRDSGEEPVRGLTLLCPWLDMTLTSESYRRFGPNDPILDHTMMRFLVDTYLQGQSPHDALASPIFADLADLPETLIVVGEIDPLYSDGLTFARKLEAQGGTATLLAYAGMPHDFMCYPWLSTSGDCLEQVFSFQRDVLTRRHEPRGAAGASARV